MDTDTPKLHEIVQLTKQELTTAKSDDAIRECGRAALSSVKSDPALSLELAYQKLHDVPYKDVKKCWRRLYTDASLWKIVRLVGEMDQIDVLHGEQSSQSISHMTSVNDGNWLDEVVKSLDMALILTGAPGREEIIELWFSALQSLLPIHDTCTSDSDSNSTNRPSKRRKTTPYTQRPWIAPNFPTTLPPSTPPLNSPIPREDNTSLSSFQHRLDNTETHTPLIIENAINHWPALHERSWDNPRYLLDQTLGGRRLVPVEIGSSYTDAAWGQRIMTMKEFMEEYMLATASRRPPEPSTPSCPSDGATPSQPPQGANQDPAPSRTAYLAQHDLFTQLPALRRDISIPDFAFLSPVPSVLPHVTPVPHLADPLLNAWFGPAGTVSPLHTDPYHNIFAQVVGSKYVRLYPPAETGRMYPRGVEEGGVDMGNTSKVDVGEVGRLFERGGDYGGEGEGEALEKQRAAFEQRFPGFREARYVEGVLGPGDILYLPLGWWHYVKSLSPSFSVSFWFN